MAIVQLTTCDSLTHAYFIKNNLENDGIECILTNEIITTLVPYFNGMMNAGVQVMINEEDLQKASNLIEKSESFESVVCPVCNSTNIEFSFGKKKKGKILGILLSLLALIPFGNIKRNFYCKDCKAEF